MTPLIGTTWKIFTAIPAVILKVKMKEETTTNPVDSNEMESHYPKTKQNPFLVSLKNSSR